LGLSGRKEKERKQVRAKILRTALPTALPTVYMTLTVGDNDMDGEIDWLGLND